MAYDKKSKKELLEICEKLHIQSYKTKNKPELILMIQEKEKNTEIEKIKQIEQIEILEEIFTDDEDTLDKTDKKETKEIKITDIISNKDDIDSLLENVKNVKNIVIETAEQIQTKNYERKLDELYKLLHKANMNALNIQFKYRSQYPIAVYNNLEMLKKRINVYNI